MESETQPKRTRGRPKKIVPAESPETTPESSTETTPVKKPRGRPAKYAPEERQEKYKEITKNWKSQNLEQYSKSNMAGQKKRLERLYFAYNFLQKICSSETTLATLSQEDNESLRTYFSKKV